MKRIVFGQVLVYATHRLPPESLTVQSTPRGRNWLDPSPILSAGFEGAGSTAESPGNAVKTPEAGGRPAGSLLLSLETEGKI